MAQVHITPPSDDFRIPRGGVDETSESGPSWKKLCDAVEANSTELYGRNGQATIDFGAFPGTDIATLAITGQTGIVAGSIADAWISPVATSDHSADEHLIDPPKVYAGAIVPGTGFTIYAVNDQKAGAPGAAPIMYGKWTINWCWQ